MSTAELVSLFHHRWSPPTLALLAERGGARFVELQRKLGVGADSLRRALHGLIDLGYVRRNPGYGHPLRPEYLVTDAGREAGAACARLLRAGDADLLLRKWSVPTLAQLGEPLRFSELRAALPGVTPRALALALKDLEEARLVRREVVDSRPPSTLYRATARGTRIVRLL
ncbi:MAG TPA: winged helix-turn-helix transcriptional regulator [Gaiellaceae bacterium]|nr:winged helix-turn-helix transcriptional regulator [Gaiellaceae bacterium]